MTRDTAFWGLVIGLIVLPNLAIGWLRGRAVGITYRGMCADMTDAGIRLSQADLGLLIGQLNRDPGSVLDTESNPEAKAIKKRHVDLLQAYRRSLRRYRWGLIALGIVALVLFQCFWPGK